MKIDFNDIKIILDFFSFHTNYSPGDVLDFTHETLNAFFENYIGMNVSQYDGSKAKKVMYFLMDENVDISCKYKILSMMLERARQLANNQKINKKDFWRKFYQVKKIIEKYNCQFLSEFKCDNKFVQSKKDEIKKSCFDNKYSQAISLSKNLIESIIAEWSKKNNVNVENLTLPKKVKTAIDKSIREPSEKIVTSIISLVNEISTLRNKHTDAGHGKDFEFKEIEKEEAIMIVNCSISIVDFLYKKLLGTNI